MKKREGVESATIDNKLYGLPLTNDVGDGVSLVFIRKDWLDKLNLEEPTTLTELIEFAQKFVDANVSGMPNGTMGIGMASDLGFTWEVIANAYGGYPDLWVEDENGDLVYGSTLDEIKNGLSCMQMLQTQLVMYSQTVLMHQDTLAFTILQQQE